MDKKHIVAFLDYGERKIEKKWFIICMLVNIGLFFAGVYYSTEKIINSIVCALISIVMIIMYVYSQTKLPFDKKHKNLFWGSYLCISSVALQYLSYKLLVRVWYHPIILILIYTVVSISVGIIYTSSTLRKIKNGVYVNRSESPILKGVIALMSVVGMSLSRMARGYASGHFYLLGIGTAVLGFICVLNIGFIVKYHFYKVIENMEDKAEDTPKS